MDHPLAHSPRSTVGYEEDLEDAIEFSTNFLDGNNNPDDVIASQMVEEYRKQIEKEEQQEKDREKKVRRKKKKNDRGKMYPITSLLSKALLLSTLAKSPAAKTFWNTGNDASEVIGGDILSQLTNDGTLHSENAVNKLPQMQDEMEDDDMIQTKQEGNSEESVHELYTEDEKTMRGLLKTFDPVKMNGEKLLRKIEDTIDLPSPSSSISNLANEVTRSFPPTQEVSDFVYRIVDIPKIHMKNNEIQRAEEMLRDAIEDISDLDLKVKAEANINIISQSPRVITDLTDMLSKKIKKAINKSAKELIPLKNDCQLLHTLMDLLNSTSRSEYFQLKISDLLFEVEKTEERKPSEYRFPNKLLNKSSLFKEANITITKIRIKIQLESLYRLFEQSRDQIEKSILHLNDIIVNKRKRVEDQIHLMKFIPLHSSEDLQKLELELENLEKDLEMVQNSYRGSRDSFLNIKQKFRENMEKYFEDFNEDDDDVIMNKISKISDFAHLQKLTQSMSSIPRSAAPYFLAAVKGFFEQ